MLLYQRGKTYSTMKKKSIKTISRKFAKSSHHITCRRRLWMAASTNEESIRRFAPDSVSFMSSEQRHLRMTAEDVLQRSFVEGKVFSSLMACVEPVFIKMSRKTITTKLDKLWWWAMHSVDEGWKTVYSHRFMDSTYSWIIGNSLPLHNQVTNRVQCAVLQTKTNPEQHATENLANVLPSAIEHQGLNGSVTVWVPDNASSRLLVNTKQMECDSIHSTCYELCIQSSTYKPCDASASWPVSYFLHGITTKQALK